MKINRHLYWTPLVGLIYTFLVGLIYGFDTKLDNLSETEELIGGIYQGSFLLLITIKVFLLFYPLFT